MGTILVVDDYAPNYRLVSFVLEESGHRVVIAHNGQQALDYLCAEPVDLVVTDLSMPKVGGLDLIQSIRTTTDVQDLPVIVITGSLSERDRTRAAQAGVRAFLTKPVASEDLIHEVNQILGQE